MLQPRTSATPSIAAIANAVRFMFASALERGGDADLERAGQGRVPEVRPRLLLNTVTRSGVVDARGKLGIEPAVRRQGEQIGGRHPYAGAVQAPQARRKRVADLRVPQPEAEGVHDPADQLAVVLIVVNHYGSRHRDARVC